METPADYQFQQSEKEPQAVSTRKKIPILWIIIVIVFLAGFSSVFVITKQRYAQQISMLEEQYQMCMSEPAPVEQETSSEISFGDLAISSHRLETVVNATPGKVFYSAFIERVSADISNIVIKMEGYPESIVYAADFTLGFDPQLVEVLQVAPQDAFPSYPRAKVVGNAVMVTGVSTIVGDSIHFGRPNNEFVIIRVRNKVPENQQVLTVVSDKTHVFYQTQDMLDIDRSIQVINI